MLFSLDHISFIAEYPEPSIHSHFAKHIIFSMEEPLQCIVENAEFECSGLIIQSGATHTVKNVNSKMFVILVDETCNLAKDIDSKYLNGCDYCILDGDVCKEVLTVLSANYSTSDTDKELLNILKLQNNGAKEYDSRIHQVLNELSVGSLCEVDVKLLARHACLSESRLSHLFREQVGISLSGYLVLAKMARAYQSISNGTDITSAALNAGFSSSSHFAATAKKNFGISTSEVTKHTNSFLGFN